MNTCANCQSRFSLDQGGFIWDELAFCEFCDPEEAN
jgi:hypothetical protein